MDPFLGRLTRASGDVDEMTARRRILLATLVAVRVNSRAPELSVLCRLVVGRVDDRSSPAQRVPAHLDLLVGRPVLFPRRGWIAGALNAGSDLDLPLSLAVGVRLGEAVADVELVRGDRCCFGVRGGARWPP